MEELCVFLFVFGVFKIFSSFLNYLFPSGLIYLSWSFSVML